jgi:D-alanyl-D-alanine carboxypeptidase
MAILQLVQQGKLALGGDLTRFLPDYPTHGRRITIENLLTHTSGIKNYTDLPAWRDGSFEGVSVPQLLDRVKDQPLDFAPGERSGSTATRAISSWGSSSRRSLASPTPSGSPRTS